MKLGRDLEFFNLLEAQAHVAVKASEAFMQMIRDVGNLTQYVQLLEDIEHEGDELTHSLQNRIASTFITPLDQEDLSELSHALDDVTDLVEALGARIELYRLTVMRPDIEALTELLVKITHLTEIAVKELRKGFSNSSLLKTTLRDMHTVENESDQTFRAALQTLFDQPGIDALMVIKWKEIYDRIETAVDRCEDVAKIIDNIAVKYA